MKPDKMPITLENIPLELIDKPNWIVWRWEQREGKWTKPPYQADGKPARSNDPSTWHDFDTAFLLAKKNGQWDGIGYMLNGEYTGIDFDDCVLPDGTIEPQILNHIRMLDSYTERSPSGNGFKTLVRGELPDKGHHGESIGVFDNARYFCITGNLLPRSEYYISPNIEHRQLQLNEIIKRYWPNDLKPKRIKRPPIQLSLSDQELIEKATHSNDGGKFKRLWEGDWSGFSSRSEADSSLCFKLSFWTGKDFDRIDSLFRQSGLMRDKWDREDYRQRTINHSIELSQEIYSKSLSLCDLITTSNSKRHAKVENNATSGDNDDKQRQKEGLSYISGCLLKGRCDKKIISQVMELIYKSNDPEITNEELKRLVEADLERNYAKDRNLASDVRDWVMATNGVFSTTNVVTELQTATKDEKRNINKILERMSKENPPLIEKSGKRNGEWRLIDQACTPLDWINADCAYKDLWLPLGLGEICGVQPGNILVIAGAKDSGKTGFLMNVAKENRYAYKVHYFNSEMGPAEFKMRVSNFDEPISLWKDVAVYERSDNFPDVIKPGEGNLNIIDFLEVVDEFWKVASTIQKIHQKLNGALCVIGLQKNPHVDLGRGGAFSLEKARLYLSLDYQAAKIVSCKNFKQNDIIPGNPRGYTCKYTLANGCHIKRQPPGWVSPDNREGSK